MPAPACAKSPRLRLVESDLYPPIKAFLERQGFEVKAEIGACDVFACRQDTQLVVELKTRLSLQLLLQAASRLALVDQVYLAIPSQCTTLKRHRRELLQLLRRLGCGLLLVDLQAAHGCVDVLLEPGDPVPRRNVRQARRLRREFDQRQGDPNLGGSSTRVPRVTAYRQKSLAIARLLAELSPNTVAPAQVARQLQEPKAGNILYRNVYGWFSRPATGQYTLSEKGHQALASWQTLSS